MTERGKRSPAVKIKLIVRDDCIVCKEVQRELERYVSLRESISFQLLDLDRGEKLPNGESSIITPSVWVNGKLWYLGRFNIDRFDERINRLINTESA